MKQIRLPTAHALSKICAVVWAMCIAVFFIAAFNDSRLGAYYDDVMGGSVVLGIISFCLMIVFFAFSGRKEQKNNTPAQPVMGEVVLKINNNTLLTIGLVVVVLLLTYSYGRAAGLSNKQQSAVQTHIPTALPTIHPTVTPAPKTKTNTTNTPKASQITCTGPDGKQFQTTQAECDKFNTAWGFSPTPNPYETIKCNVHPNCGGGYKEMSRESCEKMTCCQLDNNTWTLRSKDECNRAQSANAHQDCVSFCYSLWKDDYCDNMMTLESQISCRSDNSSGRLKCIESCK